MVIKVSLLVLLLVVFSSCGCLHQESQNIQSTPDRSEGPNDAPESINSRLKPPASRSESGSSSEDTDSTTPNTTWHTKSTSSQKKLGWKSPEDKEEKDDNATRESSNETTVSTIQDFKVTKIDSE